MSEQKKYLDLDGLSHFWDKAKEYQNNKIDQSYSSTSENAQSGVAVAEAIELSKENDPNCHAEFFTITATGIVSLKPEYRGASSNAATYPDSVSDMGEWAGSLNETLPTNLIIPEEVDGITVSALADGMFLDNTKIVSITFPSTITDIPVQCFNQAVNLTYLYNTEVIKTIGDKAFRYTKLEKAIFPNLEAFTGTLTFSNAVNLKYVDAGKIITIAKSTFKHCFNLRAVTAPNVTVVGQEAFANTPRLESIDFVKNLTQIDQYGFWVTKYNDWSELSSTATLGEAATVEKVNPTGDNFWTNIKPTACKNPTPTAFCQRDPRWADSIYGADSNRAYKDGCLQFCIIHAYSGLTGKKYNTPFEFEEDVKKIESVVVDGVTYTGTQLLGMQDGTITKAGLLVKGLGFTNATIDTGIWTSNDLQALYNTLANGGYAAMTDNTSPTGSHAILAHGITENGEIMLLDSELRIPYDQTQASRYNLPFNKLMQTNSSRSDFILIPKPQG